jgi:hypothetical protein
MFSKLEIDDKTYDYFSQLLDCVYKHDAAQMTRVENLIQVQEIEDHLKRNGLSKNDTSAQIAWITLYASSFRTYLNAITLAVIVAYAQYKSNNISYAQFCTIVRDLDDEHNCIETIHS